MDRDRALLAIESINTDTDTSKSEKIGPRPDTPLNISKTYKILTTKKKSSLTSYEPNFASNPTIKYFRDISRRRIEPRYSKSGPVEPSKSNIFLPFSRDLLLHRIQTFQKLTNWNIDDSQDSKLTPLTIALRGWVCSTDELNKVVCPCCATQLSIKLPSWEDKSSGLDIEDQQYLYVKIEDKYLEKLISLHADSCPWRVQQSPLSIYEINFNNLRNELVIFRSLYVRNLEQEESVRDLKLESVLSADSLSLIASWLEKNDLIPDDKIMEITLLGWLVELSSIGTILQSTACTRRILLRNEPINLLDELKPWCAYVKGYKVLLEIFRAVSDNNQSSSTPRKRHLDVVENDTESSDQDDVANDPVNSTSSVDDTLERLNKLRKIIF